MECYRIDWTDEEGFPCQARINAENVHEADEIAYTEFVHSHNYEMTLTEI